MKRRISAFLLSFAVLAAPAMAAKGAQRAAPRQSKPHVTAKAKARAQHSQRSARATSRAKRVVRQQPHRAATHKPVRAHATHVTKTKARATTHRATARTHTTRVKAKATQHGTPRATRALRARTEAKPHRVAPATRTVRSTSRVTARHQELVRRQQAELTQRRQREVAIARAQQVERDRALRRTAQAQRLEDRRELRRELRRETRAVAPLRNGYAAPQRFRGLDRNGDGIVAREEWRGNDVSFARHDRNGDGVLAGVEVATGPRRVAAPTRLTWRDRIVGWFPWGDGGTLVRVPVRAPVNEPVRIAMMTPIGFQPLPPLRQALPVGFDENRYERIVRVDGFGPVDVIVDRLAVAPIDRVLFDDRFLVLDTNRDAYLAYDEWSGPRPLFRDLDRDRNGLLAPVELRVADPRLEQVRLVDRERYVAFHLLDVDDDGVIAPWEWTGDMDLFFILDVTNDGVVSQEEYLGLVAARPVPVRYAWNGDLDLDGDGYVERVEWVGDPYRFASLDMDRDGRVEKWEALAGWMMRV